MRNYISFFKDYYLYNVSLFLFFLHLIYQLKTIFLNWIFSYITNQKEEFRIENLLEKYKNI